MNKKTWMMNAFLKEILEQPAALENTLNYYCSRSGGEKVLGDIKKLYEEESFDQIIFTGMGSSYFLSYAASALFNSYDMPAFVINSGELLHYNPSLLRRKSLLICCSQSGESYEIKQLLKELPANVYCLGITNETNSTLGKKAHLSLLSIAGSEKMTSTKTYVTTTLLSFILGWHLAGQWDDHKQNSIRHFIRNFKAGLDRYKEGINEAISFLGDLPVIQTIARGPSYSTALQSSLMFKEAARIPSYAFLGGEFRHGPMEMVREGFKAILFAPEGRTYQQMVKMAKDIMEFGGKVLLITNNEQLSSGRQMMILPVSEKDEFLFSIEAIIPMQFFINNYTQSKGFEAGYFAHGAKVTGVE